MVAQFLDARQRPGDVVDGHGSIQDRGTDMRAPGPEPRLDSAGTPTEKGGIPMAKRGNKKRARKKKKANHGKRPNA
ncbi:hypothetical protein GCM10010230_32870 [Streptomyces narbonensis]|nr:hypothetical protein GCM10010230_32870 [Streptomyces narbonensis]